MTLRLAGYNGTIWLAVRDLLTYVQANLNTAQPLKSKSLVSTSIQSLKNASNAMAANLLVGGAQIIYANLSPILTLPLQLDPATTAFMRARVQAVQTVALAGPTLSVVPLPAAKMLPAGKVSIPDPGLLEWMLVFNAETPPNGLTAATLAAQAQAGAAAWSTILNALLTQGVQYTGSTYSAVKQMGAMASVVAQVVGNAVVADATTASVMWNLLVALPTISRYSSFIYNDPTSLNAQNTVVARLLTINAINQFNNLMVALRDSVPSQPSLATVRQGDTLMTIANRYLGDYTQWRDIATINSLQPPYITDTPSQSTVSPGQQIFLPNSSVTPAQAQQQNSIPNYLTNYLGVDLYYGPLNEEMIPWTGDFQAIGGYQNLALSLGRRLQTTLGNLLYHPDFGSRIPPEVGSIADQSVVGYLKAYTTSALKADPRVQKVLSVTVNLQPNGAFQIIANVQPNGIGAAQITVNQVVGPLG